MSTPRRKVSYFLLEMHGTENAVSFNALDRGVAAHTVFDEANSATFYYVESAAPIPDLQGYQLLFISSKYHHSPDYVNRTTLRSRPSSKSLDEGEKEKTHAVLIYDGLRGLLAIETRQVGTPLHKAINLIEALLRNSYSERDITIAYSQLLGPNFWSRLNELNRVAKFTVFTRISVRNVGEALSQVLSRSGDVKEDLALTIKAKRGRSVRDLVRSVYRVIGRSQIISIKAEGRDDADNPVSIMLDQVTENSFMDIRLANDGTVDSSDFFLKLTRVARAKWDELPNETTNA